MAPRAKTATALAIAVALLSAQMGCGSGSSDASGAKTSLEPAGTTAPSAAFIGKTGNNHPARFGKVATGAERDAASGVLEESLRAREAGDWAAQCATLTAEKISQALVFASSGKGCASGLKVEAEPLTGSKKVRENTMAGPISVLRVDGNFGYALYHGKKHQDYAMLMKKEGGKWKVAHLATTEVP